LNLRTTLDDDQGRATRQRVAPSRRTALSLMLVLLVCIDPLACMTYCWTWSQLYAHSAYAAQHQPHDAGLHSGMSDELANVRPVVLANLFVCLMPAGPSDSPDLPSGVQPLPLHEHQGVELFPLLLVLLLTSRRSPITPPRIPQKLSILPLLRPPIAAAM
jgi:hypothetical protein